MKTKNQETIKSLNRNLKSLNNLIDKSISFKYILLRGIVTGLATAIGATIVAGLVIGILSRTIDSIDDVPVLGKFVDATNIKEVIEEEK